MNIVKLTTDNTVEIVKYPEGEDHEVLRGLYELIGRGCDTIEIVKPRRLYTLHNQKPSEVVMIVDEDGLSTQPDINLMASYLYESDTHMNYIFGNVLLCGVHCDDYGEDLIGLDNKKIEELEYVFRGLADTFRKRI